MRVKIKRLTDTAIMPTYGSTKAAGMTTNYQQLKTIYQQRRHHALPDWQMFCDWCLTLPLFTELCVERNK